MRVLAVAVSVCCITFCIFGPIAVSLFEGRNRTHFGSNLGSYLVLIQIPSRVLIGPSMAQDLASPEPVKQPDCLIGGQIQSVLDIASGRAWMRLDTFNYIDHVEGLLVPPLPGLYRRQEKVENFQRLQCLHHFPPDQSVLPVSRRQVFWKREQS
jgi:hypothetical protein